MSDWEQSLKEYDGWYNHYKRHNNVEGELFLKGWYQGAWLHQQRKIDNLKDLLNTVNEHAETCSIFIYNDKECTCYYEKIKEYLDE